ncbi:MAG: glycosyltransferase family 4 protein [Actinomycetota bacterium]
MTNPTPHPPTSPVRVAIDVTSLAGPRTGVGHVTAALLGRLASRPDVALRAYAVTGDRAAVADLRLPPGTPLRITGVPARVLLGTWRWFPVPRIDRWTGRVDVVHGTNFVVPPTGAGALVTVHDVAFARSPELVTAASRRYLGLLRVAARRGATVHVFSDHVRAQVVELLALPPERVVCIAPGIGELPVGDAAQGRHRAGAARYVLALGTVEPRKNYPRLVAAFDALAPSDPDLRLVIAGADGWGADALTEAVRAAAHGDRVIRLGYVTDADRADLLAGARALAYPSLDEGFGHPPLEAMRLGVPVVAARAGAIPEVVGDAAVLVDPESVTALATALDTVLTDPDERERLATAGPARAQHYTWDRAADALVTCYRRVRDRAGGDAAT